MSKVIETGKERLDEICDVIHDIGTAKVVAGVIAGTAVAVGLVVSLLNREKLISLIQKK